MKKILIIALALSLGGCAAIQRLEGTTISPQTVVLARNSFDALEATATNYLALARCDKTTAKVCRDKSISAILIPAVQNARKARSDLATFQKTHPGQLGSQGLYDALQLSVTTLTGIITTYNIGAVQ